MLKLMLRSLQSNESQIFEVPFDLSIQKLKSFLSNSLFNTPNFASNSLRLYLNKDHDELSSLFPDDSLLSLGIMYGDLIYYDVQQDQIADREIKRLPPELDFLKRVLFEDLDNDFRNDDNNLVFAVIHSVFLESGFVAFDPVSKSQISLYDILKNQDSTINFTISVSYTRPEILSGGDNDNAEKESIVLKFHGSRYFEFYVDVSGCLAKSSTDKYYSRELNIYKVKYVPSIRSFRVKVILEFLKFVKDSLVFPLWINLCEKTGLDLPPCLISLPQELKLRILELLPGQDIAKMACVCKEMKNLCSNNNELWEEKYKSQFGSGTEDGRALYLLCRMFSDTNWKEKFGSCFENDNNKKRKYLRFGSCFENANKKKRNASPNPEDDLSSVDIEYVEYDEPELLLNCA